MKLHKQILITVMIFTGWALYQQNTSKPAPQSEPVSVTESAKSRVPMKSRSQATDITRDTTSLLAQEEKSRTPSSQAVAETASGSVELDLDRDTKEDLGFLFHAERLEKDYLLKTAGLSAQQYEKIQEQRRKVYQDLKKAEAWAQTFGINPDEAKKPILEKHVMWMQSSIGIGHYQRLQEAISSRLDY